MSKSNDDEIPFGAIAKPVFICLAIATALVLVDATITKNYQRRVSSRDAGGVKSGLGDNGGDGGSSGNGTTRDTLQNTSNDSQRGVRSINRGFSKFERTLRTINSSSVNAGQYNCAAGFDLRLYEDAVTFIRVNEDIAGPVLIDLIDLESTGSDPIIRIKHNNLVEYECIDNDPDEGFNEEKEVLLDGLEVGMYEIMVGSLQGKANLFRLKITEPPYTPGNLLQE